MFADGNVCTVCGYNKEITYTVTDGNNSSWSKKDNSELLFKADGDIGQFVGVAVDDVLLEPEHYTVVAGSTIVKLKPEYLAKLSVGVHKLTIIYTDGFAETYFAVNASIANEHTHTLTFVPAKDATCTECGNIAYYVCACGKLFADADAANEISDYSKVSVKALGHDYEWIVDQPASETTAGSKHEECNRCHDKKAAVEIPATGTKPVDPDNPDNPDKPNVPDTGDNGIMLPGLLSLVAAMGIALFFNKKKSLK